MEKRTVIPLNGVRICIDEKDPAILGVAYSPLSKDPIHFTDIGQLIILLDALFDKAGYPQSFQDKRSFNKDSAHDNRYSGRPSPKLDPAATASFKGNLASFTLIVNSRRNSSWQGMLLSGEDEIIGSFDGDMDLMKLIFSNL